MTDLDIDLWDHDAFQRQEHHELLARLRETDPGIHWIDEGDTGPGYWAITRLAHLKEVNRQADVFSSNAAGTQMTEPDFSNPMTQAMNDGLMIELDAPKHTRFRRIVSRWLHAAHDPAARELSPESDRQHHRSRLGARRGRVC